MGALKTFWSRLAAMFHRRKLDVELDEELRSHLEMATEEYRRRGMGDDEARAAALRNFGGVAQVREAVRMREGLSFLENLRRDMAYALRQMRRSPGFTAVVILTLALGIGANAAVFSVLNAVMLRPLDFPNANRLVRVLSVVDGHPVGPSPLDMRDFIAHNHTFEKLAVYDQWRKNVSTSQNGDDPHATVVGLAPPEFFEALGVHPILGRMFTAEEGLNGRNHVALIIESFWTAHYHRDPAILGHTLTINDQPYTVIGILPDSIPGWLHGAQQQLPLFEPFLPTPDVWDEHSRGGRGYDAIGLIKPGVTIAEAQSDLNRIAANLAATWPADHGVSVGLAPLAERRSHDLKPLVLLLMGAVGLILLIACSNLAALLLARNTARAREFAMRKALGAGRSALVRQVLTETLTFSLFASGLGLALALGTIRALRLGDPAHLPQLLTLSLDWRVLLFTTAAGLGTCVLFGIAPALLSTHIDAAAVLKQGGRGASGSSRQAFRKLLVTAQIALSLMLLVGAGLIIQTLERLQHQDLGFRVDHLMRGHLYLPPAQYPTPESINSFADRLSERLRALPGVSEASVTTIYPPADRWRMMFSIAGHPVSRIEDIPSTIFGVVDGRYLRTAGIPVIRGRDFSESDGDKTLPVAIVNQAFVRQYFPGENPIGRRIELGAPASLIPGDEWMGPQRITVTVIGVMRDNSDQGLAMPVAPQLIGLFRQLPPVNYGFKDLLVRSDVASESLFPAIERQVHALDPRVPLSETETMSAYLGDLTAVQRFTSVILTCFAALGLLLAVMGIYGVIAHLVAQRTQEIGIRLALGAPRSAVLWLISSQGLRMAVAGVAIGLVGTALVARSMASMLYGVSALDAATLACASLALILIALAACAVPARRAARIDPMRALRTE